MQLRDNEADEPKKGLLEMLKYCLAAMSLKAFSASNLTKGIYRKLGNAVGGKRRATSQMPDYYLARIDRMLEIARVHGVPKHGDKMIELGTGWLHWEAITTRLFFDVRGVLFDVWDNRQMAGLKNYMKQLDQVLHRTNADASQIAGARQLIREIVEMKDYAEVYDRLGFEYVLNSNGSLADLEQESFDLVVSAGVLEHIHASNARAYVSGIAGLLKPGGYSVHSINLRDHLCQYDTEVSIKQYLKYPDWIWRLCFENDVQYINRIQRRDWIELFWQAGLTLVVEDAQEENLSGIRVSKNYEKYTQKDLSCGGLDLVHEKKQGPT